MGIVLRAAAVCAVGAVLAVLLRTERPEWGLLLSLTVCAAVMAAMLKPAGEILDLLRQMMAWSGVGSEVFAPLVKILGMGLICRVGAELCRDAGQGAMAALVEWSGAIGALLTAAPLLRAVWEVLRSLL